MKKNKLGIYYLVLDKKIVYIGKSTNIKSRLADHLSDENKIFDTAIAAYIENKSNEEEIVDGIVSWNKRKKEKYDSNKIVNTIKYMQNENIIQKGIFQNYTINRI